MRATFAPSTVTTESSARYAPRHSQRLAPMQSFARHLAGKRRTAPSNLARKRSFARYARSRSLRLAPMQSFVRQPAGNGRTAPSAPTLQRKEKHMDITPQVLKVDPVKPYIVESRFPHSHYVRDTRDGSFIEFENVEGEKTELVRNRRLCGVTADLGGGFLIPRLFQLDRPSAEGERRHRRQQVQSGPQSRQEFHPREDGAAACSKRGERGAVSDPARHRRPAGPNGSPRCEDGAPQGEACQAGDRDAALESDRRGEVGLARSEDFSDRP